jgi:hypothetical protein
MAGYALQRGGDAAAYLHGGSGSAAQTPLPLSPAGSSDDDAAANNNSEFCLRNLDTGEVTQIYDVIDGSGCVRLECA